MASALLNLSLRCSSTARACLSEERSHGAQTNKHKNLDVENPKGQTPLVNALKATAERNVARFHFPGHHQGQGAPSSLSSLIGDKPFFHDLTGCPGLDSLFAPEGPVLEAQKQAAHLFGASETWFLVGGTTCGIQASIMATCSPGDTLILARNSHMSAFSAMVLCGAIPKYIIPEYRSDWDLACGITPSQVENAIKELASEGRKASAVFVTSPTYQGICGNLEKISRLCHFHNIPLIVDEAHGAHLGFIKKMPLSALRQGADLVIQSTHKVLSSLSQSSMLHVSGSIVDRERICRSLQTLQSTSPSYLLLASLDATRAQISENPETIFDKAVKIAIEAKSIIERIPGIIVLDYPIFTDVLGIDPLRITVGVWKLGLSGFEANKVLYEDCGVLSELTGTRCITFVINLGTSREDIVRLVSGLKHLSQIQNSNLVKHEIRNSNNVQLLIERETTMRLTPREAFFGTKKKVSFKGSVGKICGELICPYPPGIPLLVPGDVITEATSSYLVEMTSQGGFVTGANDPSLSTIYVCGNVC